MDSEVKKQQQQLYLEVKEILKIVQLDTESNTF